MEKHLQRRNTHTKLCVPNDENEKKKKKEPSSSSSVAAAAAATTAPVAAKDSDSAEMEY